MSLETVGTPALWIGFTALVLLMLAIDLGIFHRDAHEVSFREALGWSVAWVLLALSFNVGIYVWFGSERGFEFLTGYLIEKALAVDNIFVFAVIFSYFAVPTAYQHRVLFWGVLGALLMRALFIFAGAVLLQRFHWIIYLFGAFLILTGVKLFLQKDVEIHPERNPLFRMFKSMIPSVSDYDGAHFFVRRNRNWFATPLFLVLASIEVTDVIFAIDSIPAIFAVTSDPFIVFTSNIFAILGLRSMYFVLAGIIDKFHYLRLGLALVLVFVGMKMVLMDFYKIPIAISLAVVAAVIGASIVLSLLRPKFAG
jgi:tellurite resistance protein TerC